MKIKIELQYVLPVSPKILFMLISTEEGLSKWFADNVNIIGKDIIFRWSKDIEKAIILSIKENKYFKFAWEDDVLQNNDYFVEFLLLNTTEENNVVLQVTDFSEEDEIEANTILWNNNINKLKRVLGINE